MSHVPPVIDSGTSVADGDSWVKTLGIRIGEALSGPGNQFPVTIQFTLEPTTATAPYEKAGLLIQGVVRDTSQIDKGVTKDGVGLQIQMQFQNTTEGRMWAIQETCTVNPGTDGMVSMHEKSLVNNAGTTAPMDMKRTKGIDTYIATGNTASTFATHVISAGSTFDSPNVVDRTSITDTQNGYAYELRDWDGSFMAGLRADGRIDAIPTAKLHNTHGLDPKLLDFTPKASDLFYWGDTSTGQSYLAYFDGQGYALIPTAKYIKAN